MLEEARTAIARLLEVQSDDVIFTSGATESNALAILGHARALRAVGEKNVRVLYLPSAHASIVENAKLLEREGVSVEALPVKDYRVDTRALAEMLRDGTALISMEAVCGETGVVWNTREVAQILAERNVGHPVSNVAFGRALLHVDASQAPLTEKLTRAHFGADLLTLDASKVSSARGIGALIAHRTIPIVPLYEGGGQERGLRSGSEAPELARSFAMALRAAASGREAFRISAEENRSFIKEAIKDVPNVHVQEGQSQVPHILNVSLRGRDTDYLVALLDEAGFAVSSRSACETDSEEGSRTVFALTGDSERARSTLRISWGPDIRRSELARFVKAFSQAVGFVDNSNRG